jgi:hypothetical protein
MLPIPFRSGHARIRDMISSRELHDAIVQWSGSILSVDIPVPGMPDFDAIYAKLSGWTLFFDRSGWTQFTIPAGREERHVRRGKLSRLVTLL